ncbi:wall-associated receptor kinase 2-like [Ipomoea triloba]|uniref:wall-associated receptor kinase 2-like n=1 Tax=Ipomoea triloba TaxID=35885 RepID=UPI00125E8523|nr:wall-associated receptor kinase 2-like [Ipomoea triloba]
MAAFTKVLLLLLFMLQVISTFEQATPKGGLAMPGCQEKCGNLTIPYPFGIGKPGCYLDEPFRVKCNSSTKVATLPYFYDVTIYNISSDSIIINAYGSSVVYNSSSGKNLEKGDVETVGYELLQPHFSISHTKNKFVALGCDIFSFLKDFRSGSIITGCASFCVNKDRLESQPNFSSCSGYGCCQTPIQTKLGDYFVSGAHTMNTDNTTWSRNRCNYIMIVEKSFDKFDEIKCRPDFTIPSAVDWSIGNLSCAKAKQRICGHNAYCANSTREGYLCRCSQGYQGNPYLPSGCQDIDECENQNENICPKNADCVNLQGSYYCSCRQGYRSDLSKSSPDGYTCIPDHERRMLVTLICVGVGVGISILILVVAGFWLNRKLKKMKLEKTKERFFKRNGGFLLQKQKPTSNRGSVLEMKIFKTEELEKATDNFNQSRILGKGGLGTVYKGMLSDGRIVAVKKSNKVNEGQVGQFINEISILSQINHRNIVKVLGCCLETEVPLVVYEYISNGTLSQHLNNNNTNSSASPLSWTHRLRIGAEIAGALAYLHSCASTAIFHRDIKSSNILLDENYRAVISDFGLSRSVHIDRTHLTTVVGGTFGYLDPEYFRSGHLNDKSDVYAFGVVLAELLTGQKVISSNTSDEGLAIRFKTSLKQKDGLFEILDRAVANEGGEEEIFVVAKLAKRCIKLNARKRSCMMEVATELQRLARTNGKDLQRRPNGFEDSYFSSGVMSFDYSSGPISFDYNLDLSIDKTM